MIESMSSDSDFSGRPFCPQPIVSSKEVEATTYD